MKLPAMLALVVAGTVLIVGSVSPAAPARARLASSPSRPPPPTVVWTWPLDGVPRVARAFSAPTQPWLPGHRGVDLVGLEGVLVRAAGGGVVVYAGRIVNRGVVSVAHAGGLRTTYEPVTATVIAGQHVGIAEPLGVLEAGHTGCPVEACLHWGLRRGEIYLDPLVLVRPVRLRLKPTG